MDFFRGVAFGVLRIPKSDFLIMTPREIVLAYEHWSELEARRQTNENYRAREIAYMMYCSAPRKKYESINAFWPIGNVVEETKEERQEAYKNAKWLKNSSKLKD